MKTYTSRRIVKIDVLGGRELMCSMFPYMVMAPIPVTLIELVWYGTGESVDQEKSGLQAESVSQ